MECHGTLKPLDCTARSSQNDGIIWVLYKALDFGISFVMVFFSQVDVIILVILMHALSPFCMHINFVA